MREDESRPSGARVLLVVRDRRYRALVSALLSQRGHVVLVAGRSDDVVELITREGIDLVLIDASESLTAAAREAARLGSLQPPVAIVAVSEDLQTGLAAMPVLPKWTDFNRVFAAIDRSLEDADRNGVMADVR